MKTAATFQETLKEFHNSYFINEDGCWIWRGTKNSAGYGCITHKSRSTFAHRFSAEFLANLKIENLYVCHKCDVKNCVNPDHLFVGTASDNNQDSFDKGRRFMPVGNPILTHDRVKKIKGLFPFLKVSEIAARFGVSRITIYGIKFGRNWRDVSEPTVEELQKIKKEFKIL